MYFIEIKWHILSAIKAQGVLLLVCKSIGLAVQPLIPYNYCTSLMDLIITLKFGGMIWSAMKPISIFCVLGVN